MILTAAVTLLSLSGTPGIQYGDFTKTPVAPVSRPYTTTFTRLSPAGVSSRVDGPYTGKSSTIVSDLVLSDSIRVYVNEGPFSDIDIDLTDVLVSRVTDSRGQINDARSVSDSLFPRLVDAVQFLTKSGTFPKVGSDSVRAYVAEAVSLARTISLSDTVRAYVAEAVPSLEKPAAVSVSDTILVVLSDSKFLDAAASNRAFSGVDTLTAQVLEASRVKVISGEVDRITITAEPYGYIRVTEI